MDCRRTGDKAVYDPEDCHRDRAEQNLHHLAARAVIIVAFVRPGVRRSRATSARPFDISGPKKREHSKKEALR